MSTTNKSGLCPPPLNLDTLKKYQSPSSLTKQVEQLSRDPLYKATIKQKLQQTNGSQTTRSVITAASPSSTSLLYTISQQQIVPSSKILNAQSPSMPPRHHKNSQSITSLNEPLKVVHPANHFQIKTELKDKILITRERFNQLRQRKRNQDSTGESLGSTHQLAGQYSLATTRSHLILPLTHRSKVSLSSSASSSTSSEDHIDRDEEAFPLAEEANLNYTKANLSQQLPAQAFKYYNEALNSAHSRSQSGLVYKPSQQKQSYYNRSMANMQQHRQYFKIEAAKQVVIRLQKIIDRRNLLCFKAIKERAQDFSQRPTINQMDYEQEDKTVKQLGRKQGGKQTSEDQWRFVKNVVKSIEKQKKTKLQTTPHPLQDRTYHVLNHQSAQQIMRNRDLPGNGPSKENMRPPQVPVRHHMIEEDMDEVNRLESEQNVCDEFELIEPTQRLFENPQKRGSQSPTDKVQTHPLNFLTSRSNIMFTEDELAEGSQQLPMESPAGAGKFMSRTRMYVNDFITNHLDQSQVKRSLSKLAQTQKSAKLLGLDHHIALRKKQDACKVLVSVIQPKLQSTDLSYGFTSLAKHYVKLQRFDRFLRRISKKLKEQVFDKIKEYSWSIEEKRDALYSLRIRSLLKDSFLKWKMQTTIYLAIEKFQNLIDKLKIRYALSQLRNYLQQQKLRDHRNLHLTSILNRHYYLKSGFRQFVKENRYKSKLSRILMSLEAIAQKKRQLHALKQWRNIAFSMQQQELKLAILQQVMLACSRTKIQQSFSIWRQQMRYQQKLLQIQKSASLHFLMKPILIKNDKRILQQAFSSFKQKAKYIKKTTKAIKTLVISLKSQHRCVFSKYFKTWQLAESQMRLLPLCEVTMKEIQPAVDRSLQDSGMTEQYNKLCESSIITVNKKVPKLRLNVDLTDEQENAFGGIKQHINNNIRDYTLQMECLMSSQEQPYHSSSERSSERDDINDDDDNIYHHPFVSQTYRNNTINIQPVIQTLMTEEDSKYDYIHSARLMPLKVEGSDSESSQGAMDIGQLTYKGSAKLSLKSTTPNSNANMRYKELGESYASSKSTKEHHIFN